MPEGEQRIIREILRRVHYHVTLENHLHLVVCQQVVCVFDDREDCPIDLGGYLFPRSLQKLSR